MTRVLLAAMALAAFPLNSRAEEAVGSSHRAADAGAETGAQVSAPAGIGGVESRQCGPELPEVLHGAAAFLLHAKRPPPSVPATRRCRSPSCR